MAKLFSNADFPWLLDQLNLIFADANDLTLKLGVLLGRDRV